MNHTVPDWKPASTPVIAPTLERQNGPQVFPEENLPPYTPARWRLSHGARNATQLRLQTGSAHEQASDAIAAALGLSRAGAPSPLLLTWLCRSPRLKPSHMANSPLLSVVPLGFQWATLDPFLFCAHHDDHYPRGNAKLGPNVSLAGRRLGQDFELRDGFRMYHGHEVPGFPQHPHRGFETVTLVRRGFIDHSDSLGAVARFGAGDAQWLTAGEGIVHSEMFPLLEQDQDNPLELFQIWLNLRGRDKLVKPHFSMFWRDSMPRITVQDERGHNTELCLVAGEYGGQRPPAPPPHSWARQPEADVAIWTLKLAPRARFTLPPAQPGTHRVLYFFKGNELRIAGERVRVNHAAQVAAEVPCSLENGALEGGAEEAELLMLQGRPLGEPVAQHGPFVMNTRAELQQAYQDYQRTGFGGWPFPEDAPVHAADAGRFARHADGRVERVE